MTFLFASTQAIAADFTQAWWRLSLIWALCFLTALLGGRKTPGVNLRILVMLGALIYLPCVYFIYSTTYGRFYQLQLSDNYLTLSFAGLGRKSLILPRQQLKTVLRGFVNKNGQACYLSLEMISGEQLESAIMYKMQDACREQQHKLQQALAVSE